MLIYNNIYMNDGEDPKECLHNYYGFPNILRLQILSLIPMLCSIFVTSAEIIQFPNF